MKITVVAMGKIGLPLAVQFASKGHAVIGTDINEKTIDLINSGIEPFPGEFELEVKLKEVVKSGLLTGSTDTKNSVSKSDVVVIVVPLFVDELGEPNFDWMDSATAEVGKGLKSGTLVSYETTLPVGTTRNRFAKMLEKESGLTAGIDFYVAFSPERVFTGRVFEDLRKYPKLVGGINSQSAFKAEEFYKAVLDFDEREDLSEKNGVWNLGSCESSELAKLAETTYRDVNIGLANQFANFAFKNEIDIYKVIEACNSQPFSHIHQPGIAVGGHCIPIYPRMYLWNDPKASIVLAARNENKSVPSSVIDQIENSLGPLHNLSALVLGAAYRGGVKETAFSGVFDLVENLKSKSCTVYVDDPLYSDSELSNLGLSPYEKNQHVDIVILHTNHEEYKNLTELDFPNVKTVFDGRNFLKASNFKNVLFQSLGVGQAKARVD